MKRIAENRYPHSAALFKFCKEALSQRLQPQAKIIDQTVGAILSYDPADCSHWKKGKKNIRSLTTLKTLASHLQVDEHLIIEIASGKMDLEEALFEYKGYGDYSVSSQRKAIVFMTETILNEVSSEEAPIYIPEVCKIFKNIRLLHEASLDTHVQVQHSEVNGIRFMTIQYREKNMRPHTRFLLAKELFIFLCKSGHDLAKDFRTLSEEALDIHSNAFAESLLIPTALLKKEIKRLEGSSDIAMKLSQSFWVSKILINRRLIEYLGH